MPNTPRLHDSSISVLRGHGLPCVVPAGLLEGQGWGHLQVHWPPFPTRPVADAGRHPEALGLPTA